MDTRRQIFYQIVFATKHLEKTLPAAHQEELYKYIRGVIKAKGCKLYRINGMEDHLQIFSGLHPSAFLAGYVKDIKLSSNDWMYKGGLFPAFAGWQDGCEAFACSIKEKDTVIDYGKNQKAHHKQESFLEELKWLLIENGIRFDEKYLL